MESRISLKQKLCNFLEYENSTYGIKIQYPSDWSVEGGSNPDIIASFYPQGIHASYVMIQIENLSSAYTPDQYLNSLMLGDAVDYKAFPDIRFNQNTNKRISPLICFFFEFIHIRKLKLKYRDSVVFIDPF